jgi:hypothetical protein
MFDAAALRDFAARYTAAWFSHNASRVAEFYSPGGSLSVNGGSPAVGREAITETVQGFLTAFPVPYNPLRPTCFSKAMRERISTSTIDCGDSLKRCT